MPGLLCYRPQRWMPRLASLVIGRVNKWTSSAKTRGLGMGMWMDPAGSKEYATGRFRVDRL